MDDPSLVDSVYECGFVPEMWPGVLDQLATIAGARGGAFVTGNSTSVSNGTASASLQAELHFVFANGVLKRSERQARTLARCHSGFLRNSDFHSLEELARDPLHREVLGPAGLGYAAGTAIAMPTGDVFMISVEREKAKGPVELEAIRRLDRLRPHIARSAFLSARQNLTRARHTSDALALIGLPAIVMNEAGKVLAANHLVEDLKAHLVWRADDRFALKDRDANTILQQAVATIGSEGDRPVRSFVLRSDGAGAAMVAHVLPLRGSARDIFSRCAAVLVMTPVTMPQAPSVELVQSLFDLTPTEARVARGIATGETVEQIAIGGGVSHHTVRTHLRAVFGKTGCRRQAEVAALLGAIAVPVGRPAR